MKNITKRIISFSLLACMTVGIVAAASWRETITVDYGVGITVNGGKFVPTDANGNIVNPFIYNGTTYVPLRGVSQALGCAVDYNTNTKVAEILLPPSTDLETNADITCLGMYVQMLSTSFPVDEALSAINEIVDDMADYRIDTTASRQAELLKIIAHQRTTYSQLIASIDKQWRSFSDIDSYFVNQLYGINTALAHSGFIQVELAATEKNLSALLNDPYNDQLFNAAVESTRIIREERRAIIDVSLNNYYRIQNGLLGI